MTLPDNFVFTQNNLQDFEDCPRRFELRHLLHQAWPAPQTEPILDHELHMLRGEQFHRLAHQYLVGVPLAALTAQADQLGLTDWWKNFIEDSLVRNLPALRWPEITLSMPFANYRLLCKMDLVVLDDHGTFTIFDWKTSPRRTPPAILQNRWQTQLYSFILKHTAVTLHNSLLTADQVKMVYWFAEDPANPQWFEFSEEHLSRVEEKLNTRITELNRLQPGEFFMTIDIQRCAFCVYRSLCERGEPGSLADDQSDYEPPDTLSDLNFEQIGEVLF